VPAAFAADAICEAIEAELDLVVAITEGIPVADMALTAGDRLRVYRRAELTELLDTVWVEGAVVSPGGYPYRAGMRVSDLLALAFGPTAGAYLDQATLHRAAAPGTSTAPIKRSTMASRSMRFCSLE
jgi:hypothetical protein